MGSKPPRYRPSPGARIRKLNKPDAEKPAEKKCPDLIALGRVPAYLEETHGVTVNRVTVYNWAKVGKRGTKLRTVKKVGHYYTTRGDVDAFVAAMG